ncbi:hypothetical protein GCM10011360_17940 [Primorskyibacter flagellatus]|uniref:Restriction alleviation protein, Lar family n=1 Tax=Primorskyibacter flagellatus TaxID=1387277 RepID=A0A917A6Q9_9RHOB|nr:Lar family restriction alleviation protein [Primorskyibacter flagellatus]GGE30327.1 hypothetical protein GCM10011360_17940 [Primorskyibacter flagellatus]
MTKTDAEAVGLLPCPFCGSSRVHATHSPTCHAGWEYCVECLNCGTDGPYAGNEYNAIFKWNDDRAERDALQAKLDALTAALRCVREEICTGPVDDVLWHREIPAETTVDFICNTLNDDWDYDDWLARQSTALTPAPQTYDDGIREAVEAEEKTLLHFCNLVNAGDAQGGGREFQRQIGFAFDRLKSALLKEPKP